MTALTLPRSRRNRPLAFLIASLAVVAGSQLATFLEPAVGPMPAQPPAVAGPLQAPGAPFADQPGSLAQVDRSIETWTTNLATNGKDFFAAGNLAALYEARARLSGDVTDYTRAEEAAGRSLAIEPRQLDVQALHARILLATHEFSRALDEAAMVDRSAPDQPAVLAIMADARLELGDVDAAASLYARVQELAPGPAVTARIARLAFLRGDPAAAVTQAEAAHAAAVAAGETGPALSWYGYLAGTISLNAGRPDDAATWFDRAVADWPASYLALAGRARAAAALGDTAGAIEGYRAAIDVAPQPEALTALGDLLALSGDAAGARAQYATVHAIAQLAGDNVYNRQLSLFEVNHDGDVAGALAMAERELLTRKDVYGYDALAWALLANGRTADADAAIAQALAVGTRDATLLYHAGEIARSLGDADRARDLLEQALAIRGALDPLSASRAAASLAALAALR